MFLRYWFAINAKRIYIFEWNDFGIGSDSFFDISQKINSSFFVKEEGRGQVLANSELCCDRSYIIFRRPNYVGEDKRISRRNQCTSRHFAEFRYSGSTYI